LAPQRTRKGNKEYIDLALPIAEKQLIDRIRRRARSSAHVLHGIGDDCAVIRIPHGHEVLVTTDFSLEGVHFRREWHPPDSVGHRCLTRGLSDIAAMGGEPIAAFLSLAAPPDLPQKWIDSFLDGLLQLAKKFHVTLAGGDTAESPSGVLADIIVLGSVPRGRSILRSGARAGDSIYVTGQLGESAAVVQQLLSGKKLSGRIADYPAHFFPTPRIAVGRFLRQKKIASAMIDISDGLSTDLGHICKESRVGALIYASAMPLARLGRKPGPVDLDSALHGGEAYELLFTAPGGRKAPSTIDGVSITKIGEIVRQLGMRLESSDGKMQRLVPKGWQHFSGASRPAHRAEN
jgi:thiamine-monophosphate kinase